MSKLLVKVFLGLCLTIAVLILVSTACGLIPSDLGPEQEPTPDYGDELISNGDFSDTGNWEFYVKGDSPVFAEGEGRIREGEFIMHMTQLSQDGVIESWHGALIYTGDPTIIQWGAEYELFFTAKGTNNARLGVGYSPNIESGEFHELFFVNITPQMQHYSFRLSLENPDEEPSSLLFTIGDHLKAVTIDDISVREVVSSSSYN